MVPTAPAEHPGIKQADQKEQHLLMNALGIKDLADLKDLKGYVKRL